MISDSVRSLSLPQCAGLKQPLYDGKLEDIDPEIAGLIRKEKSRQVSFGLLLPCTEREKMVTTSPMQVRGLELIASENFTSTAVGSL